MHSIPFRTLPLVVALAFSGGLALAQSSYGSGSTGSATGGQASSPAQADTGMSSAKTSKDQLSSNDRKFMQDAAEGGMFEVQAAQLASSKASSADVKSFAGKLVEEHSMANRELMQLANDKKVDLPAGPPRSKRNEVEKLGKLSGKEFDEHFVREVGIKDHQTDIKKFEKASKDVKDPQLKAWVDKTLPHLRDHLAIAQKLPEAGKISSTSTGSGGNAGAAQSKGGSAGISKAGG